MADISKVPMGPVASLENFLCNVLTTSFEATVVKIDALVPASKSALSAYKGFVKKYEKVILKGIDVAIDAIEVLINELIKLLNKANKVQNKDSFCAALFACEALLDKIVELGLLSEADRTNYSKIEETLCAGGMDTFIDAYINDQIAVIRAKLIEFETLMASTISGPLELFKTKYETALNYSNPPLLPLSLVEAMALLTSYLNCVFSNCDFVETANNKIADIRDVLFLNSDYSVDTSRLYEPVTLLTSTITTRITDIRNILYNLENKTPTKLSKDDVMKNFE